MKIFSKKISVLFLPFLIAISTLCIGYSVLKWWLTIDTAIISLTEFVGDAVIPFLITLVFVLFYLKPKFSILDLKREKGGDWSGVYLVFACFAISLPTIIFQSYVETASGKLTHLENISQVDSLPVSKYYAVEHYFIDKNNVGANIEFNVSGKRDKDFTMQIYKAIPIYRSKIDTLQAVAWLQLTYSEIISNGLNDEEKENLFLAFEQQSQQKFDQIDLNSFEYLIRMPQKNIPDGLHRAVRKSDKYTLQTKDIVFSSVTEKFSDRNGNYLLYTFISFTLALIVWFFMVTLPSYSPANESTEGLNVE